MSATVLVLDGFGVGAMPDAGALRPSDAGADTLGHLVRWCADERGEPLRVPHLASCGLDALRPDLRLDTTGGAAVRAVARRAALGYPGADSFAGHQTMMGADLSHVALSRVGECLDEVVDALERAGHRCRLLDGRPLVVVDDHLLLHDNLEADPGLNWNVSASLDEVSWEAVVDVATVARRVAPVARVIAVGGHSQAPLVRAVRDGAEGTVGLDTPASGFYRNGGLRVQHMGVAIDHAQQLPELAARSGLGVTLLGKAADLLVTDTEVHRVPGVDTTELLAATTTAVAGGGLVVANVQQTDLAGHQRDPGRFAALLEEVDAAIPAMLAHLAPADLLVVTADHGNDPTAGHAFHTREHAPVLAVVPGRGPARAATDLPTLADVGGGVARHLGLDVSRLGNGRGVVLLG
ncbi:MAG: phosphopentomutase [Nocardioidaceae bacterium]|nr:phosphopentomutase [Nocardioidaceae bacterium]